MLRKQEYDIDMLRIDTWILSIAGYDEKHEDVILDILMIYV